jgi:probable HAF family extracellular repeat protein
VYFCSPVLAAAISSAFLCCPGAAQKYSVTDLGTLGGNFSAAYGVNSAGGVTGSAAAKSGSQAFIYSNGVMTSLGTLGGEYSQGQGINSSGTVAGYSTLASGAYRAFIYSGGQMSSIGTLGGNYSAAYSINDTGQVVGSSYTAANLPHAFLYSGGQMTDLGTLGGNQPGWTTAAYGINRSGTAVGYSYTAAGEFHAFAYRRGTMRDLGTLGGSYSQAYAVNGAGQITGQAYLAGNGKAHAFLYASGKMTDLGALNNYSAGMAISRSGVVVGEADVKNNTGFIVYHAVIFENGAPRDLNQLIPSGTHWVLNAATGIDGTGRIVGYGTLKSEQHAFLLTPE